MADQRAGYEVEWQLKDGPGEGRPHGVVPEPCEELMPVPVEHAGSKARFAGLLAGADAVVLVSCQGSSVIVQETDPLAPSLSLGKTLETHPSLGHAGDGRLELLLSGRRNWCRSLPPPGFSDAALIACPVLGEPGGLVLMCSREGRLSELNLHAAAAYLAQPGQSREAGVVHLHSAVTHKFPEKRSPHMSEAATNTR
jgi:hypothetical protein